MPTTSTPDSIRADILALGDEATQVAADLAAATEPEQRTELSERAMTMDSRLQALQAAYAVAIADLARDRFTAGHAQPLAPVGHDGADPLAEGHDGGAERANGPGSNPWSDMDLHSRDAAEWRGRALRAAELVPGTTPARRQGMARYIEDVARADIPGADADLEALRLAVVTTSPAYLRAYGKRMRGQTASLTEQERAAVAAVGEVARAIQTGVDADGGVLVPYHMDPTITITSDGTVSEVMRLARVENATSNYWREPTVSEMAFNWRAEGGATTDTTPNDFAKTEIKLHTATAFAKATLEAADIPNLGERVATLAASGKRTNDGLATVTGLGDASNQPFGIQTALEAVGASIRIDTAGNYAITHAYSLDSDLPERHHGQPSTAWLAHRGFYNKNRELSSGFDAFGDLAGPIPMSFLGIQAAKAEAMESDMTVLNATLGIIGAFTNHVVAQRVGMTSEFVQNVPDPATGLPSGHRGYFFWYRLGADTILPGAFRYIRKTV